MSSKVRKSYRRILKERRRSRRKKVTLTSSILMIYNFGKFRS